MGVRAITDNVLVAPPPAVGLFVVRAVGAVAPRNIAVAVLRILLVVARFPGALRDSTAPRVSLPDFVAVASRASVPRSTAPAPRKPLPIVRLLAIVVPKLQPNARLQQREEIVGSRSDYLVTQAAVQSPVSVQAWQRYPEA